MWWSWAVWVDPFSYALRALVANEFSAPRWDAPYNEFSSRRRRFTIGQAVLQVRPELDPFFNGNLDNCCLFHISPHTCLVPALGQGSSPPECGESGSCCSQRLQQLLLHWCSCSMVLNQLHRLAGPPTHEA